MSTNPNTGPDEPTRHAARQVIEALKQLHCASYGRALQLPVADTMRADTRAELMRVAIAEACLDLDPGAARVLADMGRQIYDAAAAASHIQPETKAAA